MMPGVAELGLALAAGSLTTLSPCVFPILPLVVGGAVQAQRLAPVAMGAGLVSSFAVLGVAVGVLGDAIGIGSDAVRSAGAWLLIVFGIVMLVPAFYRRFTLLLSPIADSAQRAGNRLDGGSLSGAFALGLVLGMVWTPCSGPLLGSALTLVASEGGAARGGLVLALFGLGAAIPLVAIAYASQAGFRRSRDWLLPRVEFVKKVFGVAIVLLGLAILTGWDKQLEAAVLNLLPEAWVNLTVRF
ncbi:cytochrome c biogenesis CcdA family protein [Methylococcus sp. EFPC2]|uniref:cytochrome c biogenesis CcdA family protein n=1 Tax=Methylococcus sp. EFPC2 TaxID=2812648 RepID=UPI00196826EE|nr:cytochrome c biogenesis CcdA family protein [Methylococcus sp. EFPC2]QSA96027.1 cytochrome c biogenesis protein CcdA [Methylococcus sp. EFPC2]